MIYPFLLVSVKCVRNKPAYFAEKLYRSMKVSFIQKGNILSYVTIETMTNNFLSNIQLVLCLARLCQQE